MDAPTPQPVVLPMQLLKTVLVTDDDDGTREALTLLLQGQGYAVATARNGAEALDRLREHPLPNLVLLDLWMPRMNGWEFREQQRQDPTLATVPVVVVSAGERDKALGDVVYLQKPVEADTL